jgi:hypothetical protein
MFIGVMIFSSLSSMHSWNLLTIAIGHLLILLTELKLVYTYSHLISTARMAGMGFHIIMSIVLLCAVPETLLPGGDKKLAEMDEIKSVS